MPYLQNFKTVFIGILLEALPFILLGVLISSLLQVFVSERTINRLVPKNPVLGILFACLLGILLPVCECGMIPVVRRLIRKGMPLYVGVVFILSGPIINPVVFAATYMAFRNQPAMAYARMGIAFAAAAFIGLFIYAYIKKPQLLEDRGHGHDHAHGHAHDHSHDHSHSLVDGAQAGGKLTAMMNHTIEEFFEMGKYLMFGAFVTAAIQTFIARQSLIGIGHGEISSHFFMMGFAYVLSLCSTSDAFVASSFVNTFSAGSLLTFLVFGPMLDFKSTLMMLSVFKKRFVLLVSILIIVSVFAISKLTEALFFT